MLIVGFKICIVSFSDSLPTNFVLESILYFPAIKKDFMCKIICKFGHTPCTLVASNLIFSKICNFYNLQHDATHFSRIFNSACLQKFLYTTKKC